MATNREALWASGEDESVTVNQRALIDKILARYSGEFTVFRELLQNSDDAQATEVEIKFRSKNVHQDGSGHWPDISKIMVDQWIFRNNGMIFRDEDWNRLKKIAEGNPDEEKIGAFGVGFYSLFSVTESPFVESGTQGMGFYWKDNKDQLFVRRANLPNPTGEWTNFEMELREDSTIPPIYDLAKFVTSSITFMRSLSRVTLYLDEKRLVCVKKTSSGVPIVENITKGLRTLSPQGIMAVKEVRRAPLFIEAEVMKWVIAAAPKPAHKSKSAVSEETGFFSRFIGRRLNAAPTPPPAPVKPAEDLSVVKNTGVELSIFSAEVSVCLDKKHAADLQRSTKKNPPGRLKYELVYTGKEEYDASKLSDDNEQSIFQGLRADLDGSGSARIFIGHSTAQTTGIGGHMAARFIPTVERESIDLVDKSVARWNQELLHVGGVLARVAYDQEMSIIKQLWPNDDAAVAVTSTRDSLTQRALHVMQFFAFRRSMPLDKVAEIMKDAFFACGATLPFAVITTRGVRDLATARLPDKAMMTFLPYLPVVPDVVLANAKDMVASLQSEGLPANKRLRRILPPDVTKELNTHPLTEGQAVACLKWWLSATETGKYAYKDELLDNAVIMVPARGKQLECIVNLSTIKTYLDAGRLPADGPLPAHVLPLSISREIGTASLTGEFGWRELNLLEWVQYIKDPKARTDPVYDIEISAVWAEQVLNTLARNWPSISAETKGKIVFILKDLRCVPTNSGLRIPGEVYFPGANVFPDLPVVTLPSGNTIKSALQRTLEGLGVRKDVELQILFDKMIKTNEWTISDLIKHLAMRTLQPDELARLKQTAAFSKEEPSTEKPRKYVAKDLYEPSDALRLLGLPILDWGTKSKWRSHSPEAKLAFTLGLQRQPPILTLIQLCAMDDEKIQRLAWQYLMDNVATKYPNFDPMEFSQVAFIPALHGSKKCLGAPSNVFSNAEWAGFGFLVVHPSVPKDVSAKLKLNADPSADKLFAFLRDNKPKDEVQAKVWFETLSSHMRLFEKTHFARLSLIAMVPTKVPDAKTLQYLPPNQCYFRRGETSRSYSKLFAFIDFGPGANSFLAACGTRQEPSPDEVAQRLLQDPQQFYQMVNGSVNYLTELQRIAVGQQQLSYDTRNRMKYSKFLLALRRTPRTQKSEKGVSDALDDDEWDIEYALKLPSEVVIADDINAHQLFGDKLFTAPQEDILEGFYVSLGSRKLSSIVREQCRFSSEMANSKAAADTKHLILERLPLFLHEHTHAKTKISYNWLNEKDHLVVKTFGKLTVTKSLNVAQTHLEHVQEASAFSPPFDGHSIKIFLAGNSQLDMYEIAMVLIKQLFESPKTNDALLFMTILSTDLRALKRRGYNVERILRQQQAERQATEFARAKTLAEQPPPNPLVRQSNDTLVNDEHDTPSMPGDIFTNSTVKSTLRNLKHMFERPGPSGQVTGQTDPSAGESSRNAPLPPPPPHAPSQTRPPPPGSTTKGKGASLSDISSNIDMAINACRPERNHLVHNREEMRVVKESLNEGYCDLSGHANSLQKVATMHEVHVFLPKDVHTTDIDAFLSLNQDPIARFVHVMTILSKVYNLPLLNMHIFHENEGTTIAFNRNGSIFLNLRYFLMWHDNDVKQGNLNPALISWYFTLAHEIAHNLVQPHNSEHEFYLSAVCEKHLMVLGNVLYNV